MRMVLRHRDGRMEGGDEAKATAHGDYGDEPQPPPGIPTQLNRVQADPHTHTGPDQDRSGPRQDRTRGETT